MMSLNLALKVSVGLIHELFHELESLSHPFWNLFCSTVPSREPTVYEVFKVQV